MRYPEPTEMNATALLEHRNTALERQTWHEHKEATLQHLLRCWRPGLDLRHMAEAELTDSRAEQQRVRDDLRRIDHELQRRQGEQLPLFTADSAAA